MGTRVFAEKGRVKLVGDQRDIGVATQLRNDVLTWCNNNNIDFLHQGYMAGVDVWRVPDEQQRVMFLLRWQ